MLTENVDGFTPRHLIVYSPPKTTMTMLVNEGGGVKSLDFSPDGNLLVSGEWLEV